MTVRASSNPPYLTGLSLVGRDVLVAGAGRVAERRALVLAAAGARVHLVAPEATERLAALDRAGEISWSRRPFVESDADGAWYVVAATDDPAVNAQVAAAAEARHTFCVRADRVGGGSAWTPATGTASGVSVGVLTGDPRRSAAARDAALAGVTSWAGEGAA